MSRHTYSLSLDETITRSLDQIAQFLLAQSAIEKLPDWSQALAGGYLREAQSTGLGAQGQTSKGKEDP